MKQLVYTMFITNNHDLFFVVKKKFAKKLKILKILWAWSSAKFTLALLKAPVVKKKVIIWLEFTLSFWKYVLNQTWESFNSKVRPQWNARNSSYQVREILILLCNLVALILGGNCFKCCRVTKFEEAQGKLEAKNSF